MAQISNQRIVVEMELEPLQKGKRLDPGTYKYSGLVPETTGLFGIKRNTIKITDNSVTGKGDFTVYLDKTDDNDNILKQVIVQPIKELTILSLEHK